MLKELCTDVFGIINLSIYCVVSFISPSYVSVNLDMIVFAKDVKDLRHCFLLGMKEITLSC